MTMPRRQLVDVAVTRYYHCISRCVRRAFLCGEGVTHRKAWIEARLELLAKHFAISVCGFAILDNHLHVLCRLDRVLPASLRIPCGVRAAGGRMSAQSTSGSPSP
jgi:REP element-mobilizing transposase RayT